MDQAIHTLSHEALEQIRVELLSILSTAVSDLDNDKLSGESFHSFRAILQIGLEAVRDRAAALSRLPQNTASA
jgi:hypothetical protein